MFLLVFVIACNSVVTFCVARNSVVCVVMSANRNSTRRVFRAVVIVVGCCCGLRWSIFLFSFAYFGYVGSMLGVNF